jgi:alpha-beta hydrolase superfamily lysophospholipase
MAQGSGHLAAILHLPARTPCGAVGCCLGMLSSMESRKSAALAEAFSVAGLAAVRFDFSGCGESSAPEGGELVGSRLQDLMAVIDHIAAEPWLQGGIGLMVSSLGGYLSLLAAAERPEIRATVCWATPFDLGRIRAALGQSEDLRLKFPPGFRVGKPLDLSEIASPRRVLVIHGQRDETVPWADAASIYQRLGEPGRLMLFENADHRFLDESCRELAIRATVDWLIQQGFEGNGSDEVKSSLTPPSLIC